MSVVFHFVRTVIYEELYSVEMGDELSHAVSAKQILKRDLENGQKSKAVKFISSTVVKNRKIEQSK